ncbi:hypothetical protein L3X38_011375 [Prunus dulcis]|uniref:Retrotransposon gag domain-containing protein n=1 Tax=Prunus dulcis TaxID=3755 RepID=A0AAD4WHN9_PRUDU|nr:hypothetical protein L3X38_011375 [Prunus dulcis]
MAETIKELKSSVAKPSEENERLPQEESASARERGLNKRGHLLSPNKTLRSTKLCPFRRKERESEGRKGSSKEHVNCFIDALGPHAGDYNLRLQEFSKSLTNRAYTWYTTLAPGSVRSWEDLASRFCKKYFQHEERVTTTQLNNTRQKHGEDPVDFVRRFRDLALDCYDEKDEDGLVEICISNIMADYRVYLENIGISQFSRLLEAVRKTSMSVKSMGQRTWRSEKKEMHQVLAINSNWCF